MASGYGISRMGKGRNWRNNNNHTKGLQYQNVEEESCNTYVQNPFGNSQEPWGFYRATTGDLYEPLDSQFKLGNDDELVEEEREAFHSAQGRKNVMEILSGTSRYHMDADNLSTSTLDDGADQIFPPFSDPYKSSASMTVNHHRQAKAVATTSTDYVRNKKQSAYSVKDSPVSKLEKVSKHNKLSAPTYAMASTKQTVKGFIAECNLLGCVERGYGNSGKEAREDAAIKMLKKLHIENDSVSDDSASEDDYSFGHSFQYNVIKNKNQKGFQDMTQKECKEPHRKESNSNLRGFDNCQLDQFQQKSDSGSHYPFPEFSLRPTGNKQYVWLLQSIASKMNFKVRYEVLPHRTSNNLAQCLVHLDKEPPIICYGSAKSENKAKSSAARCAFEYLKTVYQQ